MDGGIFYVKSATEEGLDLGDANYTHAKWLHLLRGYFVKESYQAALSAAHKYVGRKQIPPVGMVFFGDRVKKAPGISSSAGGCLLGLSFSWRYANPVPRVTVLSRSTELSRKFYADLVFIQVITRSFGHALGFSPDDVSVTWIIPRITQTVDFLPALLTTLGQESVLDNEPEHRWIKYIRRAWPTEKDLESKFRTRKVAVEHYFRLKRGEALESLRPSQLQLPV